MPPLREKDVKPKPRKPTNAEKAGAAGQTAVNYGQKNAPPRPKGDDLDTDVMRHKQKKWVEKARKPVKEGAKAKATKVVGKVAPAATRVASPASTVGSVLGGPSQSPKQTDKQVRSFEKKNPGWTIVKTKDGFRTVRK